MTEYERDYPLFSLCGLNCGLCPRHWSDGSSKCPGCGGKDFHLKHPSCAVISCAKKHRGVEYCFLCPDFPCKRYENIGEKDSFVTYRNVLRDLNRAKSGGLEEYKAELDAKVSFLKLLLDKYNDGRKKNYYCLAVSLLEPSDLEDVKSEIGKIEDFIPLKEKIKIIEVLFGKKAERRGIELRLRK